MDGNFTAEIFLPKSYVLKSPQKNSHRFLKIGTCFSQDYYVFMKTRYSHGDIAYFNDIKYE